MKSLRGTYRLLMPTLLSLVWIVAAGSGTAFLMNYESTPTETVGAPAVWPQNSVIPRSSTRPTLMMFAHPYCPCTRASLEELRNIMLVSRRPVDVYVVFHRFGAAQQAQKPSNNWLMAHAIPGVKVISDDNGSESAKFRALTSGKTVFYDRQGKLQFSGGITAGRGSVGNSYGKEKLIASLGAAAPPAVAEAKLVTPTFGCHLLNAAEQKRK